MGSPSHEELLQFINALQLSLETEVNFDDRYEDCVEVLLVKQPKTDQKLKWFCKMVDAKWAEGEESVCIEQPEIVDWSTLTHFLMLTRLQKDNMLRLAEIDPKYITIIKKLGFEQKYSNVEDVNHAVQIVFKAVKDKKMTLRQLSEKAGLSQTALSKFKAGNDIRLSNLIKIAKAVGLRLKLGNRGSK